MHTLGYFQLFFFNAASKLLPQNFTRKGEISIGRRHIYVTLKLHRFLLILIYLNL